MQIQKAESYRENLIALLANEKLPIADLPQTLENFIVARLNNEVIGVAGIEIYAGYGLLRSVAVKAAFRGRGIANELLQNIEELAAGKKLEAIYLLTETAAGYFGKKGYRTISRADVPAAIRQSTEFSHVCPQSATVMIKQLIIT